MDLLSRLKKDVAVAGQKAKKTADIFKMREAIRQDKKELKDLVYQIGKTYVRLHRDDYEEVYGEYFTAMDAVEKELKEKQAQLEKMRRGEHCSSCGKELSGAEDYCPSCGTPTDFETELSEEKILEEEERADEETEEISLEAE
ncbi:MAG: hypothetical protein Q4D60_10160 [Eubacteriales bacterium]|nr:hypothetical protein [Eubacteriales bacterium]